MAHNTILLQVNSLAEKYGELTAASVVTPGDLIEIDYQGKVQRHVSANTYGEHIVAIENSFEGKTIADTYAIGDKVRFFRLQVGDRVAMNLAASMTILVGSHLGSNGDGKLRLTTGTSIALFKADEAVTTTGAVGQVVVRTLSASVPIAQTTTTTTTTPTTTTTTP